MKMRFPELKMRRFPTRCNNLSFERDIIPAEEKLINTYGFLKEEINFVMKYKPSFILFEKERDNEGFKGLHRFFVEKKGFDIDTLRTLIVKYPYILSKNEEDIEHFFTIFQN